MSKVDFVIIMLKSMSERQSVVIACKADDALSFVSVFVVDDISAASNPFGATLLTED